jgi:polyhydroxyalkanoate synthesis regulator phasin
VERALKILRYCAIPLTDIKYDNKRMQRAGIELQKQCVVMDLIKGTFITEEESKQVLSALLEAVQRERPTFQIHTARQLAEWMEKEVRPPLADSMLKPIRTMMTSRDQDVFDAWADLLLISIRWMSMEILLGEV